MSGGPSRAGAAFRLLDRAKRRAETPVVFCVDIEPDPRVFDPHDAPDWIGFERFVQRLPALRERLESATGLPVALSWFVRMDPQVAHAYGSPAWAAETYADQFAELLEEGDQLGLHTHLWRWDPDAGEWIADYEDPAWAEHCLMSGLEAFEKSFGQRCTVHRAGDHFLSGEMLACLEARGVEVDLTVEPGRPEEGSPGGERARGVCPDYRGVPTEPYRSSPSAFPAPDPTSNSDPLLIPLLSASSRRPPFSRWPLAPESRSGMFAQRLAIEMLRDPPPVLAMAVRSDAALGPRWDAVAANLEHLARHRGMLFVTASAVAERVAAG